MIVMLVNRIKSMINDIHYSLWKSRIMSDAMEYNLDTEVVEFYLHNNYINHYGIEKMKKNEHSPQKEQE